MPARTRIDHRQGNRRRTLALVEIRCGDDQWAAGLVHNISPDGMFVVTESVPAVNSCVDINVVLCMAADVPLRLAGLVVHRSSSGFGMMFGELDGGARAFVEKCLGWQLAVVLLRRRSGFRVAGWQAQRVFPFEKSFHRDIQRNERSEPKVIGSDAGSSTQREQSGKSKLRLINAG